MKRLIAVFVAGIIAMSWFGPVSALNYGAGQYGKCQYGSCGITITSSGTVNLAITPTGSATCTINNDVVQVTTGATTGYTLQLASTSSSTNLLGVNFAGTIPGNGGSFASPASLAVNTWGYRVDGKGGFGAGPTSAATNTSIPGLSFATIPVNASPTTLLTTSAAASAEVTDIWYGACADTTKAVDTYSRDVVYTAMTN
ncbi:MAG: hypothetical protein WAT17_04365 [Candidatus Saccharimonadales bacterium]|jgi:hypothetical protein